MGKVQDIINKIRKDGSVEAQEKSLLQIIRANQADALDLNLSQLFQGKDAEGQEITPAYTPFTRMIKRSKGQPTDRVTLKDEGDFYNSFVLQAQNFPVVFDAKDSKTGMLTEKYGEEIFGLDSKNKSTFVQDIKPQVQDFYRKLIHV